MKNIHFIVNPIAGKAKTIITHSFLKEYFEEAYYAICVKETTYKAHAIQLTQESIAEGSAIIEACAEDGTINEVASEIVNSSIVLGIIPIGSENGLSTNFKISNIVLEAILTIRAQNMIKIDVGSINERYFFSNKGFGFDASVIKNYEAAERRSLWTYIKASLKSFKNYHREQEVVIEIDQTTQMVNPFLIFISNSNVMGYTMSLTPKASLQDGLLNVVIVPQLAWKMLVFGLLMLLKKPEFLREVHCYQTKRIDIFRKTGTDFQAQIDGELLCISSPRVFITLEESSLMVIV